MESQGRSVQSTWKKSSPGIRRAPHPSSELHTSIPSRSTDLASVHAPSGSFQSQQKLSSKLGLPLVPLKWARWQSLGGIVTLLSGKSQACQGSTWATKTETKSSVVPPLPLSPPS